jgi:hypothetical protein
MKRILVQPISAHADNALSSRSNSKKTKSKFFTTYVGNTSQMNDA